MIEYLEILFSTQVVSAGSLLTFLFVFKEEIKNYINRIDKVTTTGGGVVSTPQPTKNEEKNLADNSIPLESSQEENIPETLNENELTQVKDLLAAERTRAYIWEYNYLNHFLVLNTQNVLDWLSVSNTPISISLFHTSWTPIITSPVERDTILSVLENHYLIQIENDLITITPKGIEYIGFRGKQVK